MPLAGRVNVLLAFSPPHLHEINWHMQFKKIKHWLRSIKKTVQGHHCFVWEYFMLLLKALNIFPLQQQLLLITWGLLILHCASCITWLGAALRYSAIGVWKPYQGRGMFKKKAHSKPPRWKIQDGTRQHVWKLQKLPSFTVCEKVIPSRIHTV